MSRSLRQQSVLQNYHQDRVVPGSTAARRRDTSTEMMLAGWPNRFQQPKCLQEAKPAIATIAERERRIGKPSITPVSGHQKSSLIS